MSGSSKLKFWQVLERIETGEVKDGDKFRAVDTPISLVLEYDGKARELVYNTLMSDTATRDAVVCNSGEMFSTYERVE